MDRIIPEKNAVQNVLFIYIFRDSRKEEIGLNLSNGPSGLSGSEGLVIFNITEVVYET